MNRKNNPLCLRRQMEGNRASSIAAVIDGRSTIFVGLRTVNASFWRIFPRITKSGRSQWSMSLRQSLKSSSKRRIAAGSIMDSPAGRRIQNRCSSQVRRTASRICTEPRQKEELQFRSRGEIGKSVRSRSRPHHSGPAIGSISRRPKKALRSGSSIVSNLMAHAKKSSQPPPDCTSAQ